MTLREPLEDGGNTFMTKIKEEDSKSPDRNNLPPLKLGATSAE